jgi:hypothetical protein
MRPIYRKANDLYLLILVFLLMYGPISNSTGVDFLLAAIIFSLLLAKRAIGTMYSPPLILIFALQIYILATSLGNLYFESDWLFRFARIFLHFLAGIIVGRVIISNYGVRRLFWYIVTSSLIASLMVVASITLEPVHDLLMAEFQSTDASDSFVGTRFSGIFRTFTISYPLSVTTIFAAYLYSVGAMRGITLLAVIVITFMAAFLNARAGWIIGYGSLVVIAFIAPIIRRKLALKVLAGIIIAIALLIALAVNIDIISDTPFYLPTSIALEFLVNYVRGEGLIAGSMQDYSSKFFDWNRDANLLQIIFGSGAFGRGEVSYLLTDNGYAFILSGIGIVGFIMLLVLIISIAVPRRISDIKNPFWLILAILTLGMAAYNAKEYILFSRNFLALLAFAYAAYQSQSAEHARPSFAAVKVKTSLP